MTFAELPPRNEPWPLPVGRDWDDEPLSFGPHDPSH